MKVAIVGNILLTINSLYELITIMYPTLRYEYTIIILNTHRTKYKNHTFNTLLKRLANVFSLKVEIINYDWEKYGKLTVDHVNNQLIKNSDAILLIWDEQGYKFNSLRRKILKAKKPFNEIIIKKHV